MPRRASTHAHRRTRKIARSAPTRRLLFRSFGFFQIRFVRFELSLFVLRFDRVLKVKSTTGADEDECDDASDAWGVRCVRHVRAREARSGVWGSALG